MRREAFLILLMLCSCHRPNGGDGAGTVIAVSKKSEPAPMLTDDFGIVTYADRAKNKRLRIPFLPAPEENYFYWQCLKVDRISADCIGVDEATSGMGCRRFSCLPHIEVFSEGSRYTFQGHKGWCLESYREFRTTLRRLLRGQKIACFGGEYLDEEAPDRPSQKRSSAWFLKAVKTRRGKWSYFAD